MNSIKAIAAGLIALAALLPVSAPAANIGVYPDTCNNKEKGYTLITINGVIQPDDGEKFVQALARGNEAKVAEITDRCDTLVHLCNVCLDRRETELEDLRGFILSMFADDVAGVTTLCTYHRSKGREWSRVFLLEHSRRCPSPWAKQEWQKKQEDNLAYVAITRARADLIFVQ